MQPPGATTTLPLVSLPCQVRRWAGQDSNLRRLSQRIYSPPPLPLGTPTHFGFRFGDVRFENLPRATTTKLMTGFEPVTRSLQGSRSTIELHQRIIRILSESCHFPLHVSYGDNSHSFRTARVFPYLYSEHSIRGCILADKPYTPCDAQHPFCAMRILLRLFPLHKSGIRA